MVYSDFEFAAIIDPLANSKLSYFQISFTDVFELNFTYRPGELVNFSIA